MLVDTHAHLDDRAFAGDRDAVIRRAVKAHVAVITVGVDLPSSRAAVALAAAYPMVYAAVGVHPHGAKGFTTLVMEELRRLCVHPKVVAIGETGLDWYRNLSARQAQLDAFAAHLALAAEVHLPVIVHNRQADEDVLSVWAEARGVRGVLHAFSSDMATAEKALAAGLYISLAGPLTYPKAETLRTVGQRAPLDRLLVETDCPYLPPVPWRGQRNEPAYVTLVADALARLRRQTPSRIAEATTRNAQRLFGLSLERRGSSGGGV